MWHNVTRGVMKVRDVTKNPLKLYKLQPSSNFFDEVPVRILCVTLSEHLKYFTSSENSADNSTNQSFRCQKLFHKLIYKFIKTKYDK